MSGIDWDSVPEATHYDSREYVMPAFMRKSATGDDWEYLGPEGWKFYGPIPEDDIAKMTVRPASEDQCAHDCANKHGRPECGETASPAWSGEGLPPVGRCELRMISTGGDWHVADIKFASRNVVVWDWEDEPAINGLCTAYVHTVQFRPIRTKEQIAVEAREAAIKDLMQLDDIYYQQAAAIYDAGYRKVSP